MEEGHKCCSQCGVDHPLHFFRKTFGHGYTPKDCRKPINKEYRKTICKACESKERIKKKNTDPLQIKARNTIISHAQRQGTTFRGFLRQNDLTISYISMLFEREWKLHELGFGCLSCAKPMKDMLEDFTLDLIDPNRPPTRSNLRVICRTCNVGKGKKDPTEYDLECAEYRHNESSIKGGIQFNLSETKPTKTLQYPLPI